MYSCDYRPNTCTSCIHVTKVVIQTNYVFMSIIVAKYMYTMYSREPSGYTDILCTHVIIVAKYMYYVLAGYPRNAAVSAR